MLVFIIFLNTACSNTPQFGAVVSEMLSSESYNITVTLNVSNKLNPNKDGRPSPLVIKILQLNDDAKFTQAGIEEILMSTDTVIGEALVGVDQAMAFPGKNQELKLNVNSQAKYLGVVAAFQHEGGTSKKIIPIEGRWSRDICIKLTDTSLSKAERC